MLKPQLLPISMKEQEFYSKLVTDNVAELLCLSVVISRIAVSILSHYLWLSSRNLPPSWKINANLSSNLTNNLTLQIILLFYL